MVTIRLSSSVSKSISVVSDCKPFQFFGQDSFFVGPLQFRSIPAMVCVEHPTTGKGGTGLKKQREPQFIYTYNCNEDELSLCRMEMRSFFGQHSPSHIFKSPKRFDPDRSPFMKERIEVIWQGADLSEIADHMGDLQVHGQTFKVVFVKRNDLVPSEKVEYEQQRDIERELGSRIQGTVDVKKPDRIFGIVTLEGRWYFGRYERNRAIWLRHVKKPRPYSIALPARIARAVANIAVPDPAGTKAIDPCCGTGTVLIEALSMGIDMTGRDMNPLVTGGARENLAFFGLAGEVVLGPISEVSAHYHAAVIDLPYNHMSKITPESQLSILRHARRIADRVIVISIEPIDAMLTNAGFTIEDRCVVNKGYFARHIMVCL
jgi:tRNA G10  N-methylase Trm11